MNSRFNAYRLGSRQTLTLPRSSIGKSLQVLEGTLWLTSPEDGDQILVSGQTFAPLSRATVISPFDHNARFEIAECIAC